MQAQPSENMTTQSKLQGKASGAMAKWSEPSHPILEVRKWSLPALWHPLTRGSHCTDVESGSRRSKTYPRNNSDDNHVQKTTLPSKLLKRIQITPEDCDYAVCRKCIYLLCMEDIWFSLTHLSSSLLFFWFNLYNML